ncbi:MAG: TIR domain-containing protein [Acidobacteria bacterium]|nr:TIR domain-containing protein [Acidobacteriota bacterium]MBI3424868.1 TIR domain-containing protein [Acidobacteriota bacterium]
MARDEAYLRAEQRIETAYRSGKKNLGLSNMGLTELPESLGQLTRLEELDLSNNKLTTLPEQLSQFQNLVSLNLSLNQLTALPESLSQLHQLQSLYLSGNRLTVLPKSLGELTQLQNLFLNDNQLKALPESLGQLKALKQLFLHDNPGLWLPQKILGPTWQFTRNYYNAQATDPRAILAFYFGQHQQHTKPLDEVKLLLVGHGRVGKTSLSKALRGAKHKKHEPETPGIERHQLPLTTGESTITAHVWDFGGQEFLHQTHQFFFSERSIYLIVLSGRQGRPMQEAEYWLRLIRTYGKGSPVVIALNQIKASPFTVDEYFLQEKYPEVKAVVRTDCDPREGIAPLGEWLGQLAGEMESVRQKIAPTWARVRTHLEEMADSFVSFAGYRQICAGLGVTEAEEQEILATILDCLGIALNYRDDTRLRDTSVLKPRWLVDGIYTILRWLQKHETNGEMRLSDFAQALPDAHNYPAHMHAFLLALMEKFELCFPVESAEGLYLVPALLNANQPGALTEFTGGGARRIQFRYDDVRPPGLLPRFIVRSHTLSEQQARWLRGVVLARGQARALVRGDHEGRFTDVYVVGENADERVWLAEFILAEMRVLNDKLPVRTFVESEAQPGAWTELELLREASQRHETARAERRADGQTVMVPVEDTLREVESIEASAPKENPLPLFICYAHADEQKVKQLLPSLKVLARRGYITPWRDTDLVPGEDWDETIQARLAEARIILFMVSRNFLASDYITDKERPLAMRMVRDKRAVVLPVLLSKCSWDQEDFAALENLPRKGELVSAFTPRDEAWALVEEGIKKAVGQMRKRVDTVRGA